MPAAVASSDEEPRTALASSQDLEPMRPTPTLLSLTHDAVRVRAQAEELHLRCSQASPAADAPTAAIFAGGSGGAGSEGLLQRPWRGRSLLPVPMLAVLAVVALAPRSSTEENGSASGLEHLRMQGPMQDITINMM